LASAKLVDRGRSQCIHNSVVLFSKGWRIKDLD
jgi:hypothetical protein